MSQVKRGSAQRALDWFHVFFAYCPRAGIRNHGCYDPLLSLIGEIRNATFLQGIRTDCGMVHLMEYQRKPSPPPLAVDGIPEPGSVPNRVEQQIMDFLDGRTHGEELLHALHDHVLDEPIPERMLALFRQACCSELRRG